MDPEQVDRLNELAGEVEKSVIESLTEQGRTDHGYIIILLAPPHQEFGFLSSVSSNVDERDAMRTMQEIINKRNN